MDNIIVYDTDGNYYRMKGDISNVNHKGVITKHYALMHWELNMDTDSYEAKDAYDEDNNIYFEVTGEGKMFILYGNETLSLKLKRAKY